MPEIDELLQKDPLLRFSVYTLIQTQTLRSLANDIRAILDESLADNAIVAPGFHAFYGSFWLWTLGAYEVVRTMTQARSCFSPLAVERLSNFKRLIAELRIPFAKQEYAGNNQAPIRADASIYGFDHTRRDVMFNVAGLTFSTRHLLDQFDRLIDEIQPSDVVADHRASYQARLGRHT